MQIYLVGGAVRDQLLNLKVKDRDWVVVGATPKELLSLGYQQVGRNFPVFLHPTTKEEYALARTEKKTGHGYTGFICDFSPNITLKQDLQRRDLTINAIAQTQTGKLIDPYGGISDLNNRTLRHVSSAFSEDPLRVLRVARFAARYHYLGFKIATETLTLMVEITSQGELEHLTIERIWLETEKALNERNPEVYFTVLHKIGAFSVLFPEFNQLYSIYTKIDNFSHNLMILKQAVALTENTQYNKTAIRFSALCYNLASALTKNTELSCCHDYKKLIMDLVSRICIRLKLPNAIKEISLLYCEYNHYIHEAFKLTPQDILTLFNKLDIWRKPQRFEEILLVCEAEFRAKIGSKKSSYLQPKFLLELYQTTLKIDISQIIAEGFEKAEIKQELNCRRLNILTKKRLTILPYFTN